MKTKKLPDFVQFSGPLMMTSSQLCPPNFFHIVWVTLFSGVFRNIPKLLLEILYSKVHYLLQHTYKKLSIDKWTEAVSKMPYLQ